MQKAAEEIIEFQDRQEAQALLGERDEFVRVLMDNFDARFVSRGESISISGEAGEVEQAAKIMRELQYLYRQGTAITMHDDRLAFDHTVQRGADEGRQGGGTAQSFQ